MKIYISGKITGLPEEEAIANFQVAEDIIRKMGHEPINPLKIHPEGLSWNEYMLKDIKILLTLTESDGFYVMKNYIDSKGARIEYKIAREQNLKLFFEK